MIVLPHAGGVASTNCYLVADGSARQAVLFDAPDHTVAPLLDEAGRRGWDLVGLWLTHGHFDHMADHALVKAKFPAAKMLVHRLDEPKLLHPGIQTRLFGLPFTIPPGQPDGFVEDGQVLQLGNLRVEVIHTPGHSPGHVMYHFPDHKALIGGDLIIMGAVGRTDLPDADYATLQRSIRRVMRLPGDTRLFPGHGEVSTLAEELQTNPYVIEAMEAEGP